MFFCLTHIQTTWLLKWHGRRLPFFAATSLLWASVITGKIQHIKNTRNHQSDQSDKDKLFNISNLGCCTVSCSRPFLAMIPACRSVGQSTALVQTFSNCWMYCYEIWPRYPWCSDGVPLTLHIVPLSGQKFNWSGLQLDTCGTKPRAILVFTALTHKIKMANMANIIPAKTSACRHADV